MKFKKRLASRTKTVRGGRVMFDANERWWIMLAVGGLLLFAYLTGS